MPRKNYVYRVKSSVDTEKVGFDPGALSDKFVYWLFHKQNYGDFDSPLEQLFGFPVGTLINIRRDIRYLVARAFTGVLFSVAGGTGDGRIWGLIPAFVKCVLRVALGKERHIRTSVLIRRRLLKWGDYNFEDLWKDTLVNCISCNRNGPSEGAVMRRCQKLTKDNRYSDACGALTSLGTAPISNDVIKWRWR